MIFHCIVLFYDAYIETFIMCLAVTALLIFYHSIVAIVTLAQDFKGMFYILSQFKLFVLLVAQGGGGNYNLL